MKLNNRPNVMKKCKRKLKTLKKVMLLHGLCVPEFSVTLPIVDFGLWLFIKGCVVIV